MGARRKNSSKTPSKRPRISKSSQHRGESEPQPVRAARSFLAGQRASIESKRQRYEQRVTQLREQLAEGRIDRDTYVIRDSSGFAVFDVFKVYQKAGGKLVYRTFYRKVKHLELNKYIVIQKVYGGNKGNTSVIQFIR